MIVVFMLQERTFSYTGHCFEAIAYFLSIVFLQNCHLRFLKSFSHMRNATVNDTTYILSHKIKFSNLFSEHGQLSVRRTLILVPTVSVLERVDCMFFLILFLLKDVQEPNLAKFFT